MQNVENVAMPGMFERKQNAAGSISLELFIISYKHTHLVLLAAETPL